MLSTFSRTVGTVLWDVGLALCNETYNIRRQPPRTRIVPTFQGLPNQIKQSAFSQKTDGTLIYRLYLERSCSLMSDASKADDTDNRIVTDHESLMEAVATKVRRDGAQGEGPWLGSNLLPKLWARSARPLKSTRLASRESQGCQNEFVHCLEILREHRRLLLTVVSTCLGLAIAVALFQPTAYRAKVSIEVLGINGNFLNLQQVDPSAPTSGNSGDSFTQTQLELLKRDALTERVVRRLDLQHNSRFASQGSSFSWFRGADPVAMENDRILSAIRTAQKKLRIVQVRQSNLIQISFDDTDPRLAASFVDAMGAEAFSENQESRWNLSQSVGASLGRRLDELRRKMANAESELENYSATVGLVATDSNSAVDTAHLQQLQDQLAHAEVNRIQKEARYRIARDADFGSLPEILDDPALREYRVRLAELRRQQVELTISLTPDHPKLQRIQAQISELEFTINNERNNIIHRLRNEYDADRREETAVAGAVGNETSRVSGITQKEIHYNTLKRELETARSMYEDVSKRVNDAELASVSRATGIRIVDAATIPEKLDVVKTRLFISGIGTFAGLLIAGIAIFFVEQTNTTVKWAGLTPSLLNVPELGIIPSIPRSTGNHLFWAQGTRSPDAGEGRGLLSALKVLSTKVPRVVPDLAPIFDASFQSVINSILFSLDPGKDKRVIAVSSPGPGEGKTTITANMGIVLSEIGYRVLLIDADLRRPALHDVLGVQNESGLVDILSGNATFADQVRSVRQSSAGHLDLISAGTALTNPYSLLHSKRMSDLVEAVRTDYDLILIDTPPLLFVPESRLLGRVSDWSILVLRAGKTTAAAAVIAHKQMDADGTSVMGTILNDCDPQHSSYEYLGYPSRSTNV